jgi:hypothetical protein
MDAHDYFPNDDYFPDADDLFGDMAADANASSFTAPYGFLSLLLGIAFGLLVLAIDMDMMFVSYLPDCITIFSTLLLEPIIIFIMIIMFDLLF